MPTILPILLKGELGLDLVDRATGGAAGLLNALTGLFDLLGHELGLKFVGRAPGLLDETARVSGHARELARPEDDQNDQPYDYQLFPAYAKHAMLLAPLLGTLVGIALLLVLCSGAPLFGTGLSPPRRRKLLVLLALA